MGAEDDRVIPKGFKRLTPDVNCSFCEGRFCVVAETAAESEVAVVHTMPYCQKFAELDPDRFLQAARLARLN